MIWTITSLENQARKHGVCPTFECRSMYRNWADVVICDYNYVFDPNAFKKIFQRRIPGEYLFLVDRHIIFMVVVEEMYSAAFA